MRSRQGRSGPPRSTSTTNTQYLLILQDEKLELKLAHPKVVTKRDATTTTYVGLADNRLGCISVLLLDALRSFLVKISTTFTPRLKSNFKLSG